MVTVTLDKRAIQMAGKFLVAKGVVDLEIKRFIEQEQDKAVKIARKYLDMYVYDSAAPQGSRRTHLTWEEIRAEKISIGSKNGYGMVHINRAAFTGFYYPFILNKGRSDINYQPRPFWRNMIRDMRGIAPRDAKLTAVMMGQGIVKGIGKTALIDQAVAGTLGSNVAFGGSRGFYDLKTGASLEGKY